METQVAVKKTLTTTQCKKIFKEAFEAGSIAAGAYKPTPMVVGSPTTPFGSDIDFTQKTYLVEGGVCGFAWVNINPANCKFVKYLKSLEKSLQTNAYGGGYNYWVRGYGQSMQLKEEFALAFAEVLMSHGIRAYAQSRMD